MDVRPTTEAARAPAIAPTGDRRGGSSQQERRRRPPAQARPPGRPPTSRSGYEVAADDGEDDGVSMLL